MRPSIVIAATAVLIAAAGAGYYALEVYPQHQFRAALDQTLSTLPHGMTATYKDAHYSVASHLAVVNGLTVHGEIPGDPALPFDVTIDTVETSSPNLDFSSSWSKAQASPAAFAPDTALKIADSVVMKGVTVHSSIVSMTGASIRVDNSRVYPWALLHDGIPGWNDVRVSLAQSSGPKTLNDLTPLLRLEAVAMLGVAYDFYAIEDAKITETLPTIKFAYSLRKVTSAGYDRGVIKQADAEGITGEINTVGTFSIDSLAVGASDFRAPLLHLINGEPVSPALLDGIKMGRIDYRGFAVQPPGQPMIRLGGLSVGPVAFANGAPVAGELAWTDLTLSRSQMPDEEARDAFNKLDLETMTISFRVAYDWDVAGGHASVRDTMLKVNELGTVGLSAEVTNLQADIASLYQARLAHAKLRVDDASLVNRLLRMGATRSGVDLDTFRKQIVTVARQQGAGPGDVSPVLAAAGQAVGDFVESPHSLTIEISPPTPLPIMALQQAAASPSNLATQLGLKVSANAP